MAKIDPANFLKELPTDKGRALCELARRVDEFRNVNFGLGDYDRALLAKTIEQFGKKNRLSISWPMKNEEVTWHDYLENVLSVVGEFEFSLDLKEDEKEIGNLIDELNEAGTTIPFGFASLRGEDKQVIHEKLNDIRSIIESSELNTRKKNALFARIAKLTEEVDREGTRTDAFFSFGVDLAMTAGEMAEKAKPAIKDFKDILRIILARRAETEGVALPSPDDYPALPKPDQDA